MTFSNITPKLIKMGSKTDNAILMYSGSFALHGSFCDSLARQLKWGCDGSVGYKRVKWLANSPKHALT